MTKKKKMVLVPEEEVERNMGTILEALNDYVLWWDQKGDAETRNAVKRAINFASKLEANIWGDA